MSATFLLLTSLALLMLPWLLGPFRAQPLGEIHGLLRPLWHLNRLYCGLVHDVAPEVTDAVPARGPALLVANHTCGVDHLLIQSQVRRTLGFMVAEEYYNWPVVKTFAQAIGAIPVKRDGRDLSATRSALRALKQGRVVPLFPEGRITPQSGRVIGQGKQGAAFLALKARVPVIPCYLSGTPPTDDILQAIYTPSHTRVVFGPPIDLTDLRGPEGEPDRAQIQTATDRLMAAITDLKARQESGEPTEHARFLPRPGQGSVPSTAAAPTTL